MVNAELVELCRTVVAAIQESDSFEAPQLRRLLLHIVPQLLAELDILANVLESVLSQRGPADQPAADADPTEERKTRKRKRRKGRK